jgi:hypothetical protein
MLLVLFALLIVGAGLSYAENMTFLISHSGVAAYTYSNGTLGNTTYNTTINATQLNSSFALGNYTSFVFDAGYQSEWKNISWLSSAVGELPGNQQFENKFGSHNANMIGNLLLMHMNEQSGSITDFSGNGNSGTASAGVIYGEDGKFFTALAFDGTTDYVEIDDDVSLNPSNITIEAWVMLNASPTSLGHDMWAVDKYTTSGSDRGYTLLMDTYFGQDRVGFYIGNSSTTRLRSSSTLSLHTWHHVTATYNGSLMAIYINGSLDNSAPYSNGILPFSGDLYIGGPYSSGSNFFNGTIDELAIYNRSLSEDEVFDHYLRGAARLNLSARSCDDLSCSGESFTDINNTSPQNLSDYGIADNRYVQYDFGFCADIPGITPDLFNVSIHYQLLNNPPLAENISLNSSLGTNTTDENLSVYYDSSDPDGNPVYNITTWKVNGTSWNLLHMPFEGGSNSTFTKDYSGFGNNGSIFEAIYNASGGFDGFGAYEFDGSNDYIQIGNDPTLNQNGNITASAWIKPENIGAFGHKTLFSKNDWINSGWGFFHEFYHNGTSWGKRLRLRINGQITNATSEISEGEWQHVAFTYDGSYVRIYQNGQEAGSYQNSTLNMGNSNNLRLGSFSAGGNNFNGTIDSVAIYNRSLSAEQIFALYQNLTNLIVSRETAPGENWEACITPNDGFIDGQMNCSNELAVLAPINDSPNVTIQSPLNTTYNTTSVLLNFTATDGNGIDSCWYVLNAGAPQALPGCQNLSPMPGVSEGFNTFRLFANDTDNNTNSSSVNFTTDTTFPSLVILSPQNTTYIEPNIDLNYTVTDTNLDTCYFILDSGAPNMSISACTNTTLGSLVNEPHNITVFANDSANNTNTSTVYFALSHVNISNISADPDPQGYGLNTTISANVTGAESVLIGITPSGGSEQNYTMQNSLGDIFEFNYSNWINGTYSFAIYGNRSDGTWESSSPMPFTLRQDISIQIRTMKDDYGFNDTINITDPYPVHLDNPMINSICCSHVEKIEEGDNLLIQVNVSDEDRVDSVEAVIPTTLGEERIPMALTSGDVTDGTWSVNWIAHDLLNCHFIVLIIATNDDNETDYSHISIGDPPGVWELPDNSTDPQGGWMNNFNAMDGDIHTYADDNSNPGGGWGRFIYFNITEINSDRVRVWSDYGVQVNAVDVDVFREGSWTDVHQGPISNLEWEEVNFTIGDVSSARFRYNYAVGGWIYWLYELQFYNVSTQVTLPVVSTIAATSVEEDTAVLHSSVLGDGGDECNVRFLYGNTSGSYTNSTSWVDEQYTSSMLGKRIYELQDGRTYYYIAQVNNSAGMTNGSEQLFTTGEAPAGWISATGFEDPSGEWNDEENAFDDELFSEASSYHDVNDPQGRWSFYLYLNRTSSITSDKIRFNAKAVDTDLAQVDIYNGSSWVNVFDGPFNDRVWEVVNFNSTNVSRARVRFRAIANNRGFEWQLAEFDFYKKLSTPPENQSKIDNHGAVNASCYLSFKTQFWDGSGWQDDDFVNETSPRVLLPGEVIKLDYIWNPTNYSTNNLSYGSGTYRIYTACLDNESNLLMNANGSYVNNSHNFTYQTSAPLVNITSPENETNYSVFSNMPIAVNVTSNATLSSVVANVSRSIGSELHSLTFNSTSGLWESVYMNTNYVDTYTITVIATNINGMVNDSESVQVNIIDNEPPETSLLFPPDAFVNTSADITDISFMCNATDNYNLKNISLFITDSDNQSFTFNDSDDVSGLLATESFMLTLGPGRYTWNCLTYDSSGNLDWADSNRTLRIGLVPTINLTSPENITYNISSLNLNYSVNDSDTDSCWYFIDGSGSIPLLGCANTSTGSLTDGNHTLSIHANDSAGNENSSSVNFTIDTTPPDIVITLPANSTYNTSALSLNYSAVDPGLDSCWYVLNAGAFQALPGCQNLSTIPGVIEGPNTLAVFANDSVNNTNSTTVSFTVDTTIPLISIQSPQNISYANSIVDLDYSVSDSAIDSCWFEIDAGSQVILPGCQNTTLGPLGNGFHELEVFVNDSGGNTNSSTVNFTINPQPPESSGGEEKRDVQVDWKQLCPDNKIRLTVSDGTESATNVEVRMILYDPYSGIVESGHTNSRGTIDFDANSNGTYRFYFQSGKYEYPDEPLSIDYVLCYKMAEPECLTDSDCPSSESCQAGECQPVQCNCGLVMDHECIGFECCSDDHCNDVEVCSDNECVPLNGECGYAENHKWTEYACCSDSDCPDSQECADHECIKVSSTCADDAGCAVGEICSEGKCMVPESQEVSDYDIDVQDEVMQGDQVRALITVNGEPSPGVTVFVTYPDGSTRSYVSDESGFIEFPAGQEGEYTLGFGELGGDEETTLAGAREGRPAEPLYFCWFPVVLLALGAIIFFYMSRFRIIFRKGALNPGEVALPASLTRKLGAKEGDILIIRHWNRTTDARLVSLPEEIQSEKPASKFIMAGNSVLKELGMDSRQIDEKRPSTAFGVFISRK